MLAYYPLVSGLGPAEVEGVATGVRAGSLHPMEAKKRLAWTVTRMYHGEDAATAAEAAFTRQFQRRETPEKIDEITLEPAGSEGVPLLATLVRAGLVPSNSEGRRLIQQGAVEVDGDRVAEATGVLATGRSYLIRVGKRRFRRVTISSGKA